MLGRFLKNNKSCYLLITILCLLSNINLQAFSTDFKHLHVITATVKDDTAKIQSHITLKNILFNRVRENNKVRENINENIFDLLDYSEFDIFSYNKANYLNTTILHFVDLLTYQNGYLIKRLLL